MAVKKKIVNKKTPDLINPVTGLSARQEEFGRQFIVPTTNKHYPKLTKDDVPFNGTRAALRAGYAKSGAHVTACRLLKNANVQAFMAEIQKPALDQFNITQERILQEMASLAFSNIKDFLEIDYDSGEAWVDISKASDQQLAALTQFDVSELPPVKMVVGGEEITRSILRTKIKIADKRPVLEFLAKREGMTRPDSVDVNVTQSINEEDRMDLAKRVAFMLRQAADKKEKKTKNTTKNA